MDTILRLPQGHSCDDVRRKPLGNNPMADGPHDTTPHRQPITPSTALAKLTETTNRIKLLTRRSASRDGLWDVTGSAIKILRNQFNSRLCILRSLWYVEPLRLVTVGRWLSPIDRDTSIKLDALDDHIRVKTTQTTYHQAWTTDSPRQDGLQTVYNIKPYGSYTLINSQNQKPDTAPNNQTYALAPSSKHQDDTPINEPRAFHGCWPAAGECHLCGFSPQHCVGIVCIGRTKVCDSCSMTGHMIKAFKKGPELDVINPSTLADTPVPDPKKGILQQTKPTYTANPPDDQNTCMVSGEEVNSPEEGIHDVMHQDNINRKITMIVNDKPTSATNTGVIRHPQRKAAQGQTLILGIEDRESPKERISTTHLWKKFSETTEHTTH